MPSICEEHIPISNWPIRRTQRSSEQGPLDCGTSTLKKYKNQYSNGRAFRLGQGQASTQWIRISIDYGNSTFAYCKIDAREVLAWDKIRTKADI